MKTVIAIAVCLSALFGPVLGAELKLGGLFTDGSVFQRGVPVPVWGTAEPGQSVRVEFAGQTKTAIAGANGKWSVALDAMAETSQPRSLQARGGGHAGIDNVLVGEVWVCSGQSNMAMIVDRARDADREKATAALPGLRVFTVQRATSLSPLPDCSGNWMVSSPETAGRFSATAFFFGRELHRELGVPVGLIVAAWSGSAIEAWTSREVQEAEPALDDLLEKWKQRDAAYTPEIAAAEKAGYDEAFAAWKTASREAVKAGESRPQAPRRPVDPREHWHHPFGLFNGMIAPLIPYRIRGVVWYQGETNAFTEESSALYERQLPLLVNDWRDRWGQGDFPMAWIQLPFTSARSVAWARIRESMRKAASLPDTAMIVTLDLGEERRLHPLDKQAFGHRLALWARAEVYGQDLAWSGPLPAATRAEGDTILIQFDHTAKGLVARGGDELKGFEVCDGLGEWRSAKAVIDGDGVAVSCGGIKQPTAVRYAWANHPEGNLFNGAGLPASPFHEKLVQPSAAPPETTGAATKEEPSPRKAKKPVIDPPANPPLGSADVSRLPEETARLDIFLLMGFSSNRREHG